jgi:DNA-binding transcriptional ArsR family regulator
MAARTRNAKSRSELLARGNIKDKMLLKRVEVAIKQDVTEEAKFFKALSNPVRLQILRAIQVSELCVCILVAFTNYNYSALSHHLKLLKDAKLVDVRREGNFLIYSLTNSAREILTKLPEILK